MTKDQLELVLGRVRTWPKEAQDELLRSVERIEADKVGVYKLSPEERAAVADGLAQADRGEFVSDEDMDAFFDGKEA